MKPAHDKSQLSAMPLTASQLQMWAGQQMNPASPLYNMALAVEIWASVDVTAMQHAWHALQIRQPGLRARVVQQDGQLMQCASEEPAPLEYVDASQQLNAAEHIVAQLQADTEIAFHLDDRLTRAMLVKLDDNSWVWYIKQHHVITDAWSFKVIWEELCRLYADQVEQGSSHAELSVCSGDIYREYASESHAALDATAASHWQSFGDIKPLRLLQSTVDLSATHAPRLSGELHAERWASLQQLAMRPAVRSLSPALSQATVLLTLLVAYLHRISGQGQITVGVPTANRDNPEHQRCAGLFVEVLPLTVAVAATDSFDVLASRVRGALMQHLKCARPGACSMVKAAQVSAVFNFINVHLKDFNGATHQPTWLHSNHIDAQHALRVQVSDWAGTGELQLDFDLNDSVYSHAQQTDMLQHWWSLFDAMVENAEESVGAVALDGSPAIALPSMPPSPSFNSLDVVTRFAQTVDAHAHSIAIQAGKHRMTYAELDKQSSLVAKALLSRGIGAGHRVGVHLGRSPEFVVAVFGILKAGAAYVTIETRNPPKRVDWLARTADIALLICESDADSANDHAIERCSVRELLAVGETSDNALPIAVDDKALAYILFTSGSTGTPKGVMISRGALRNYISWAADFYCRNKPMNFPLFTPLGFDLTVTSLFVPLMVGGAIHVYAQRDDTADTTLLDVIEDNAVDIVKLTPAHLQLLVGRDLRHSRVQQLIVGGEDFKSELARKIDKAFAGEVSQHNEYGPTECTVGCIVHTFNANSEKSLSVPIGKTIAGVKAYVLNPLGISQPVGVMGELVLAGKSLADGYWQRDDLTTAAFVDSHAAVAQRLYRTGDMAWLDEQSRIRYAGRQDEQVKIRGARIELAEIEAACLDIPGVSATVAHVIEGNSALADERFCVSCGLSSRFPDTELNTDDVCGLCSQFAEYEDRARGYFRSMDEFDSIVAQTKQRATGDFDCMMLLSGGKDSSYALGQLVDRGLRVLAFTLDNGYISEQAMANIARVCSALGVEHRYGRTPAMNEIFVDSLSRYSNVCNGCFKVLYTLSLELAEELGVATIFTGLSRGQFFETRLTGELFSEKVFDIQRIDAEVLDMRRAYHQTEDAVSRCMNVKHVRDPDLFERIQIVDFYRYSTVNLGEMYDYLDSRLPWIKPSDTGRSTNCLINDVGIYVHRKERGFHNYSLPYSWDVRLGHKERDEALEELDDAIDETFVARVLNEIGYQVDEPDDSPVSRLALYYVAASADLSPADVLAELQSRLPAWMVPAFIVPLDALPLSANGKVDRDALPQPAAHRDSSSAGYRAAQTETEKWLSTLWSELLKIDSVGIDDNFFDLNGDSLTAIRLVSRINQRGYNLSVNDLFDQPSIAALANMLAQPSMMTDALTNAHDNAPTDATPFSGLNKDQMSRIGKLLNRPSAG